MKYTKKIRKQLESEKWIQAVRKLWLIAQLLTSLLTLNEEALRYWQQPNIANEITLNLALPGAYEDIKESQESPEGKHLI